MYQNDYITNIYWDDRLGAWLINSTYKGYIRSAKCFEPNLSDSNVITSCVSNVSAVDHYNEGPPDPGNMGRPNINQTIVCPANAPVLRYTMFGGPIESVPAEDAFVTCIYKAWFVILKLYDVIQVRNIWAASCWTV